MPWPSLSLLIPINPGHRQAGIISQHVELGSDGYQQLRDCVSQAGVPVLPSLPSAFPATAAFGSAPVPFPLVPHSLCPSSSLSIGHRQRWLTGKCITGSGRKGKRVGGWATRLFPLESGGSSTKTAGYCSKVCLFVPLSRVFSPYLCLCSQQPRHRGIIFSLFPDRICQHRNVLAEGVPEKLSTNTRGLIRQPE